MSLSLITPPATEPLTLLEAKLHIKCEIDDDNDLISTLIVAAREYVETFTHRALITQIWDLGLCSFPSYIEIPKAPLQRLPTAPVVTYLDTNGATQTWSATNYTVDAPAGPWARCGFIFANYGVSYPSTRDIPNAVTVRFYAGYGLTGASVPSSIKAAMKLLIGHWWSNRESVSAVNLTEVPQSVSALLWPFKSF
jgi:uncharacterized phiE125 gp8 family phage protein